jgi:recombination protein RecT
MSNIAVKKQDIQSVQQTLEGMKAQFAMALPDHIKPERMVRVALTAVQNTPKLLDCNRNSFYLAVLRAAQLGLEPDGILGQAYLLPYGENVQLIVGYKGLIDLARRSGEVSNIIAKEVYKNDEFTVDFSQEIPFVHKPRLEGERGPITHFWAMARFKDTGFHWDYMTLEEVTKIRDNSTGYKAAVAWSKNPKNKYTQGQIISPWEQNFVEMGKKTGIRRISKFLPMSVQRAAVVEDLVDAGKRFSSDQFGEIIIEGGDGIIEGTAETVEDKTNAGKLDEFAGATASNESQPAPTGPKLEDFLDDISNAPHFEGLRFKADQALATFPAAPAQVAINKAISERQAALTAEIGKKAAAEPTASARKLFQPKDKSEGEAA